MGSFFRSKFLPKSILWPNFFGEKSKFSSHIEIVCQELNFLGRNDKSRILPQQVVDGSV